MYIKTEDLATLLQIQYERVATLVSDAKTVAIDGAKMTSNKLKYYWEEMNKTGEEVENTDPANNPEDKKVQLSGIM